MRASFWSQLHGTVQQKAEYSLTDSLNRFLLWQMWNHEPVQSVGYTADHTVTVNAADALHTLQP